MFHGPSQLAPSFAALVLIPFAVSPSCGSSRPSPSTPATMAPATPTDAIQLSAVRGAWTWSHLVDEDGIRRIETERWKLDFDGPRLRGGYDRKVTFLSLDGKPFDCNQALSYELQSHYQVSGTAHNSHLELKETGYSVAPSPCEGGYRKLGHYEGFLQKSELLLVWKGGSQRLSRPPASDKVAEFSVSSAPDRLNGRWSWHNSAAPDTNGVVRVEREDWELAEVEPGRLLGSFLRVVTVYASDGRPFPCSGTSSYRYTDRYSVEGLRTSEELILTEVDVDAEKHPCLAQNARHLDQAIGRVVGSYLELTWRGDHRQVLHQTPPSRDTAQR